MIHVDLSLLYLAGKFCWSEKKHTHKNTLKSFDLFVQIPFHISENPNPETPKSSFMANLLLLLTILLIIPNLRPFSAAQPPASAPIVSSISIPSPSPATILLPPSSPVTNITPSPPPSSPPIVTITPSPPPSFPPSSSSPIVTIAPLPPPSSPSPIVTIAPLPPPSSPSPIVNITPPPPLSPPPTTTINSHTPPPQPIQLNNIIDALIGAGDFAGWANILSNTNPPNLPLSATFFIPGNDALSHLPTSTASGAINFDPLLIAYHIIPQRLSFSDLLLFKSQTRLPTLLPSKSILITNNSPSNFSVDNSPITHPDMYTNSDVSVHGIGTILNYTAYGGNPFQPPVQQAQHPPSEVANNRRSDSATMFTDYHLVFATICAVFAFNIDMERFNKTKIAFILCGLCFAATAHGVSLDGGLICFTATAHGVALDGSCVIDYVNHGAPAIFKSPECTHWVREVNWFKDHDGKCDLATRQGHQPYQEDHMTCNLVKMPVPGRDGIKEAKLDVLEIFDGHGEPESSEMANQKLLDYFLIHVLFHGIKEAIISINQRNLNSTSPPSLRVVFLVDTVDESSHNNLKEALLHAIYDIDLEFSSEAFKKHYYRGSTATVVLMLNDEEILVASLGDSPALLCKGMKKLRAEKLTRNHRPDEEDERTRIQAGGGFVRVLGVPRVNGRLAVSRAIGDISLKRFCMIAEPEVKGWRKLTRNDSYLVIASDRIFKSLTPDDVCNIIEQRETNTSSQSIVMAALKKGTVDNLSAAIFPLREEL